MQDIHDRVDKLLNLNKYKAKLNKRKRGISKTIIAILLIFALVFNFIPVTFNENNIVRGATLGNSSHSGTTNAKNYRMGVWDTSDGTGGEADNITVYVRIIGGSVNVSCALYEYDDYGTNYAGNLIGYTEQRLLTGNIEQEEIFSFNEPKPTIDPSTNYYVMAWFDATATEVKIGYQTGTAGYNVYNQDTYDYPNWENPCDGTDTYNNFTIYLSYSPPSWSNTAPEISNPSPNATSGTKPYEVCRLNVTLNDLNGNNQTMNVTFRSNHSGSWQDLQTNSSIPNGTYICLNTSWITSENTKYYWSANVSDGCGGFTNETYHFTTGAEDPGYTSYYVAKNGNNSWDGRSPCNRTNDNGPFLTVDHAWEQLGTT